MTISLKGALISRLLLLAPLCLLAWPAIIRAQPEAQNGSAKREVTVEDTIATIRLAADDYFRGKSSKGLVAEFSPDGKSFVIVLRKGNLENNTNEFSLLLYKTAEALHSPKPDKLLEMSSTSNREAIAQVKWLSDNQTLIFRGENPGEVSQIYEFNIRTRQLRRRTASAEPITDFDCTPDGGTILFQTETPHDQFGTPGKEQIERQGVVITDQWLGDLLAGRYGHPYWGGHIFVQQGARAPVSIPIPPSDFVTGPSLSISPNGQYGLVRSKLRANGIPKSWAEYDFGLHNNDYLHLFFNLQVDSWSTPFPRFLLVNVADHSMKPLWDAPGMLATADWAKDGKSVFLRGTNLPFENTSGRERQRRQRELYDVAISVDTGNYRTISEQELPQPQAMRRLLNVTLEEDVNTSPKIFVADQRTGKKALLLDLDPRLGKLKLGKVEAVEWTADGVRMTGGLYLPPDYASGHKYPLVIQTHGFNPKRFSMDGLNEWSSGFAARALAAQGFLVLQLLQTVNPFDSEGSDGKRFGVTGGQAGRNLNVRGIESAIDYLDAKGIVDKRRVGIVGFSRSVSWVGYLLTHSTRQFAAASLVNGVDGGYFQELVYPQFADDKDQMNGGASPFGEGLKTWLKESPSFSLGEVRTPLRLLELGGANDPSELWEWFASLQLQRKPVDYIFLPDAAHLVVKPWERMVAQQGLVDWFRFWLQGYEDPDPAKAEQYRRWEGLCDMQRTENPTRPAFCVASRTH